MSEPLPFKSDSDTATFIRYDDLIGSNKVKELFEILRRDGPDKVDDVGDHALYSAITIRYYDIPLINTIIQLGVDTDEFVKSGKNQDCLRALKRISEPHFNKVKDLLLQHSNNRRQTMPAQDEITAKKLQLTMAAFNAVCPKFEDVIREWIVTNKLSWTQIKIKQDPLTLFEFENPEHAQSFRKFYLDKITKPI